MTTTPRGEIIKAGKGAEQIGRWLDKNLSQVQMALPAGANAERFGRVFVTEVQRVAGLVQCTPHSLIAGFLQAAQCGLEIGSHLGQAYLIPFRVKGVSTATLIVGYKGLVSLAYRSGIVSDISASAVRDGDHFEYQLGTSPTITHRLATGKGTADAEITYAYAIAYINGSERPKVCVMTRDEIDKVKRSSRGAARSDSPWNSWFSEMAAKTALRRICKTLPQTPSTRALHSAVIVDEQSDANIAQTFDIDVPDILVGDIAPVDDGTLTAEQERKVFGE